ncbi:MAG: hypothetical protein GY711_28320 [bacterium]|nr:hypothetical protein [bacterium]
MIIPPSPRTILQPSGGPLTLAIAMVCAVPSSAQWSQDSLTQPRGLLSGTSLGRRVLFAGGIRAIGGPNPTDSDHVDIFDTATGLWSVGSLANPRRTVSAATVGPLAIFAGGYVEGDVLTDEV